MATTGHKTTAKYQKSEVLKQLRDAQSAVDRTLKTHEEKLAQWREEAPRLLTQKIAEFGNGKDKYYGSRDWEFAPPTLATACSDYRIQAMNRDILRIEAMDGDVIPLRSDDPIWNYVGLAACL